MTDLVDVTVLGPALTRATGDDRWSNPKAELVSGGKSNLTYRITSEAGSLILRRPPEGPLLPSAHDMGREARIQRALHGSAIPVPQVVLDDDGDLLGVPFYVMHDVAGVVVREQIPAGLLDTDESRVRLSRHLAATLADLHQIDPDAVGLGDLGRRTGLAERQLRRWSTQWSKSTGPTIAEVEHLHKVLSKWVPPSTTVAILHGDFRLDNCILDPGDPTKVAAVLDWELSTLGDPASDVGLLLFYWADPGEEPWTVIPNVTASGGFLTRREILDAYTDRSGRPVEHVEYYQALAAYKFAVIVRGIADRAEAGSMAGQHFGELEDEVARIARRGLELMEGN